MDTTIGDKNAKRMQCQSEHLRNERLFVEYVNMHISLVRMWSRRIKRYFSYID